MPDHTPGPTAEELLAIVAERDHLRAVNADLLAALEEAPAPAPIEYRVYREWYRTTRRAAIAKAKGDAE